MCYNVDNLKWGEVYFLKKSAKIISITLSSLLFLAIVGLLIYEYISTGTVKSESIFKGLMAFASIVIFLMRIFTASGNNAANKRKKYELAYKEYIEFAFTAPEQKKQRNLLFKAIDMYNSNRYAGAISILKELKKSCFKGHDLYGVNFFLALSYTDMGASDEAISVYREILARDETKSTAWSNLGLLHASRGDYIEAEDSYKNAIKWADKDPYPLNNLAVLYLKAGEYEDAKEYAEKALALKGNMFQASNTLTILYEIQGDTENADKYFKRSVASGEDPARLRRAIELFKSTYNN